MIDILNKTRFTDKNYRVPEWALEIFQEKINNGQAFRYLFCGRYIMYAEINTDDKFECYRAHIDCKVFNDTDKKESISLNEFEISRL